MAQGGSSDPDPNTLAPDLTEDLDEELEAQGPADLAAMSERAARLAHRAVALGRLGEAQGWTRLWRQLRLDLESATDVEDRRRRREAADAARNVRTVDRAARTGALLTKLTSDLAALQPALGDAVGASDSVHSVHSAHPVSGCALEVPATAPRPRNRADRRRAAKLAMAQRISQRDGP